MGKRNNKILLFIVIVIFSLLLTSCGSSSISGNPSDMNTSFDSVKGDMYDSGGGSLNLGFLTNDSEMSIPETAPGAVENSMDGSVSINNSGLNETQIREENIEKDAQSQKIIYYGSVSLDTLKFDETLKKLDEKISEYNCIIESEEYRDDTDYRVYWELNGNEGFNYRTVYKIVRVPSDKYFDFISGLSDLGQVTSSESKSLNITKNYNDTKIILETYEEQLKNLNEMYKKATTIEEMIQIEARVSEVQAEINQLKSNLSNMDMQVAYSTVEITVHEVQEYTKTEKERMEMNFFEKVIERFVDSFDNFVDFLENLVYTIIDNIWGIVIIIIVIVVLKKKKKLPKLPFKKKDLKNKGIDEENK